MLVKTADFKVGRTFFQNFENFEKLVQLLQTQCLTEILKKLKFEGFEIMCMETYSLSKIHNFDGFENIHFEKHTIG